MRAWRDFTEQHLITPDEQLNPEQAMSAQCVRDFLGNRLCGLKCCIGHRLWLPGLAVITIYLNMADRRAETGAAYMTYGQQGDLVIELDKAFHNDATTAGAAAFLGVMPGVINLVGLTNGALALAG